MMICNYCEVASVKLLNTSSRIHAYASSYMMYMYGDSLTCINYFTLQVSNRVFKAKFRFRAGHNWFDKEAYGKLGNDTETGEPYMEPLFWPGTDPNAYENEGGFSKQRERPQSAKKYLKFYDNDNHCGVFTLRRNGKQHCELHVWRRNIIEEGPYYYYLNESCMVSYHQICGEEKPTVTLYTGACTN
uniref:Lipocalin n=1 Tax=Rhipicephalus zambeziensis TaxID=60191 RepID=A0A224YGY3_9ACAR